MEITRCTYNERCVWVGQTALGGVFRKTNKYYNVNPLQHICGCLHPGESVRDLFIRMGVHIRDEDH